MRQASGAAISGLEGLRRSAESWSSRPQAPSPAEVHEAARGLALGLAAATRVCGTLAYRLEAEGRGSQAAEAQSAAQQLAGAVEHLTRLGVMGAEADLGLEEWADPPQVDR